MDLGHSHDRSPGLSIVATEQQPPGQRSRLPVINEDGDREHVHDTTSWGKLTSPVIE